MPLASILRLGPLRLDVGTRRLALAPRDPAFYSDPYRAYATLHAHAPVAYWEELGMWCFFAHADVDRLLRDRRFGREVLHVASRAELGLPEPAAHTRDFDAVDAHSMLEREPPAHTRLRSLVSRAFVPRRVEGLRPAVAAMVRALADAFPDGPFDLLEAYATPIPVRVIARLLGVPEAVAPRLLDWSHRMVRMYAYGRTRAVEDDANAAAAEFSAYVRGVIAERRAAPGDDLLSALAAATERADRLSDDELVSTTILLLNAGHEATVHAIGNAVRVILEQGADPAALFAGEAAAAHTVEEVLRFAPPLHFFARWVLEDTEAGGIRLTKGERIGLVLGATGRDPRANPEADRFDPTRAAPAHTAFGAGIHYCLGAPLARLELQVALSVLFARWPRLALAEPPRVCDSYPFHGLERLMVRRDPGRGAAPLSS